MRLAVAALDTDSVWALLLELARDASSLDAVQDVELDARGRLEVVATGSGWLEIDARAPRFSARRALTEEARQLLDIYLPICLNQARNSFTLAHVGQSLDGQIATSSGASRNVTGPENICHLHRLRALSDAVLVGASTLGLDDPQLTTRLVHGESPTRVVIDPWLRSPPDRRLFHDGAARTLVLHSSACKTSGIRLGRAELVAVPAEGRILNPRALRDTLHEHGLRRLFIEGGGVTVSRFIEYGALDRLHVTICPVIIGQGSPGLALPGIDSLSDALRPKTRRFWLGNDVLFDCDLRSPGDDG